MCRSELSHRGQFGASSTDKQLRRQPKREALPAHLPRVDQRIEPEGTHCPMPECGQPVVRVARASLNAWTSLGDSSSCSVRFAASQGERPRLPGTTSTASRINEAVVVAALRAQREAGFVDC